MTTYQITVMDANYLSSLLDVLYVRATSPEGALRKARQHAEKEAWESFEISEVKRLDGTVVP